MAITDTCLNAEILISSLRQICSLDFMNVVVMRMYVGHCSLLSDCKTFRYLESNKGAGVMHHAQHIPLLQGVLPFWSLTVFNSEP